MGRNQRPPGGPVDAPLGLSGCSAFCSLGPRPFDPVVSRGADNHPVARRATPPKAGGELLGTPIPGRLAWATLFQACSKYALVIRERPAASPPAVRKGCAFPWRETPHKPPPHRLEGI